LLPVVIAAINNREASSTALKGEREYEVKQLIGCRLKGEARPDYVLSLSLSTGKLRPLPVRG
jgi:hypothetical protein